MKNIEELYNEFKSKGFSDDDAFTEAYSVICNRDFDEDVECDIMEANL